MRQHPPFTNREYQVLSVLMEQPGRIFTRDELLQKVWGLPPGFRTRVVSAELCQLRRKLKGAEGQIETIFGQGYRFVPGSGAEGHQNTA